MRIKANPQCENCLMKTNHLVIYWATFHFRRLYIQLSTYRFLKLQSLEAKEFLKRKRKKAGVGKCLTNINRILLQLP